MKYVLKLSSFSALVLALLAGSALFWVSQQVQKGEREQRKLAHIVEQEREAIRVLNAEWDYLNRPDRLEELAQDYLKMGPVKADGLVQNVRLIPEPVITPENGSEQAATGGKAVAKPARPKPVAAPLQKDETGFKKLIEDLEEGTQ